MSAASLQNELDTVGRLYAAATSSAVTDCPRSAVYPTSSNADACEVALARSANLRTRLDALSAKAEALAGKLRRKVEVDTQAIDQARSLNSELSSEIEGALADKLGGQGRDGDATYFYRRTLVSGIMLAGALAGAYYVYIRSAAKSVTRVGNKLSA